MAQEANIKIKIDGQEATIALNQLDSQLETLIENFDRIDDGSEDFDHLKEAVENFKNATKDLQINIDTDQAQESVLNLEESIETLYALSGEEVEVEIDVEPAKLSITELRNAYKEAQDEVSNAEFGSVEFDEATFKAAQLKDQINDVNEAIKSQTGEPIERLSSQFSDVSRSIASLDFEKATKQLATFGTTARSVNFAEMASNAKNFAVTLGGQVLSAIKTVGIAIASNPIGLIATIIAGVVLALVSLREKFKSVEIAINAITAPIKQAIQFFKEFAESIGILDTSLEKLEKSQEKYNASLDKFNKTAEHQLAIMKANGATERELAEQAQKNTEIRIAANELQLKSLNEVNAATIDAYNKRQKATEADILAAQRRGEAWATVTSDEEKVIEIYKELTEQQAQLGKDLQLAVIGTANAIKKEAQDEAKSLQDRQKAYADYVAKIQDLRLKYSDSEEERIRAQYQKELDQIKGNTAQEIALRDSIIKAREIALNELSATAADKVKEVNAQILTAQAEIDRATALAATNSAEEIANIERSYDEQILQVRLETIERERDAKLRNAKLAADEINAITLEADAALIQARQENDDKEKARISANIQYAHEETLKGIDAEIAAVQKARTELESSLSSTGILGFRAAVDEINKFAEQEKALVEQKRAEDLSNLKLQLDNKLLTEEAYYQASEDLAIQYNQQIETIEVDAAQRRRDVAQQTFEETVAVAQQGLNTIIELSNMSLDNERSRLEERSILLESSYEKEKAYIEANIKDEKARANALAGLDKKFQSDRLVIEKQNIELQKKQIKRDRNAALAQIALANAQSIAKAAQTAFSTASAAGPGAAVVFGITIAALLATVAATISQAKNALKEADAAGAALGAGGGGSSISLPSIPETNTAPVAPTAPETGQAAGTNTQNQQFNDSPTYNPIVSVVDINLAQERVAINEVRNTIG